MNPGTVCIIQAALFDRTTLRAHAVDLVIRRREQAIVVMGKQRHVVTDHAGVFIPQLWRALLG